MIQLKIRGLFFLWRIKPDANGFTIFNLVNGWFHFCRSKQNGKKAVWLARWNFNRTKVVHGVVLIIS